MKKLLNTVRNIFIWTYERGTWQYDLLVILIIATVFLVPSQFFGDRDRPLRTPNQTVVRRWKIDPSEISTFAAHSGKAEMLKDYPGEVVRLYLSEVVRPEIEVKKYDIETDARGKITGYTVWFQ